MKTIAPYRRRTTRTAAREEQLLALARAAIGRDGGVTSAQLAEELPADIGAASANPRSRRVQVAYSTLESLVETGEATKRANTYYTITK